MFTFASLPPFARVLAVAALLLGGLAPVMASPVDRATAGAAGSDDIPLVDADLVRTALQMPLPSARITSGFEVRLHPIRKTRHHHNGVDFAAPRGTPIRAADDGIVEFAGTRPGYGKVVYIAHLGGHRTTIYAHLHRIEVRAGQRIGQGDVIGTVGSTGLATGPHLHFEVREDGLAIDPMSLAFDPVADPDERLLGEPFQRLAKVMRKRLAEASRDDAVRATIATLDTHVQ